MEAYFDDLKFTVTVPEPVTSAAAVASLMLLSGRRFRRRVIPANAGSRRNAVVYSHSRDRGNPENSLPIQCDKGTEAPPPQTTANATRQYHENAPQFIPPRHAYLFPRRSAS